MSTLKSNYLQHPSSSTANLTLAADGSVSGGLPTAGRNLIINGAMQVAQRSSGQITGITGNGYKTADRWDTQVGGWGAYTQSIESDGPTGTGLTKSLKMLCTTSASAPGLLSEQFMAYHIEGQDLQRVAKGTVSAQQLTMSFWVKSNRTGTYIVWLYDVVNNREVAKSYTVSASGTWERKVLTFPADTTGAFSNNNSEGLMIRFYLGAGSSYQSGTLATSWATPVDANRAVGQVSLSAAVNNYWQITGVQLEVGPVATPFEFEPFETTLRKCQRYYYKNKNASYSLHGTGFAETTSTVAIGVTLPVAMRAAPTSIETSNLAVFDGATIHGSPSSINLISLNSSPQNVYVTFVKSSPFTQFRPYALISNATADGYLAFGSEL